MISLWLFLFLIEKSPAPDVYSRSFPPSVCRKSYQPKRKYYIIFLLVIFYIQNSLPSTVM
jgi:hypothetical protein